MENKFKTIKFYLRWLFDYIIQVGILTSIFVIIFSYFTGNSFLYSWEWLHKEVLIAYLWYFAPLFTLFIGTIIIFESRDQKVLLFHKVIQNKLFNRFVFFVFASIIIGAFSQVLGGCIWQIPVILSGWEGYQWRRFGHEFLPDPVLIVGYSVITAAYIYFLISYFNIVNNFEKKNNITKNETSFL